ncbi:MAG: hypothetical protein M5U31_16355, partial [Acidimicrobiia bacterium]|nr:hypothetical protein [Acidimicrobiia bacterium]
GTTKVQVSGATGPTRGVVVTEWSQAQQLGATMLAAWGTVVDSLGIAAAAGCSRRSLHSMALHPELARPTTPRDDGR